MNKIFPSKVTMVRQTWTCPRRCQSEPWITMTTPRMPRSPRWGDFRPISQVYVHLYREWTSVITYSWIALKEWTIQFYLCAFLNLPFWLVNINTKFNALLELAFVWDFLLEHFKIIELQFYFCTFLNKVLIQGDKQICVKK